MAKEIFVYIGTYTHDKSEGIYIYHMDPSSGVLKYVSKATDIENPSFLDIDPQHRYLFAVNEVGRFAGKPSGAVSSFSIDPEKGNLAFLNRKPSLGASPCHLSVDKTGRYVLIANYSGGNVCVLPIMDDGQLGEPSDFVQHHGLSVNPQRQEGPHAHSVNIDKSNCYAFVADLGLDKVMIYKFNSTNGKITPNEEPWTQVKAGSGPRHFTFHPNGRYAYLINELNSTMIAFLYDEVHGTLNELQTVPALPEGFTGDSHCADIHVTSSGKFVYGSNRGHDSLVIYAIDEGTGRLTYVGHESSRGKIPRNFAIDPTGKFLLVANQNSNNIVTFRINQQTGKLKLTGQVVEVPTPVCLKMISGS